MVKKTLGIFFLLFILLTGGRADCQGDKQARIKILFVGNSLTYVNDLPELIGELAKQDGLVLTYKSLCLPDYSFEDHLKDGNMQSEIENGGYDLVVGQQGPSALPESQVILLRDTRIIAQLCEKNNSRFALYMVWPSRARMFDFDRVIASYSNAARETGSLLCPAGLAWKKAWEADPLIALYSADDFHPSITGSLLAAFIIYASIKNPGSFDFIDYEKCSWKKEVSKSTFEILKTVALDTLADSKK